MSSGALAALEAELRARPRRWLVTGVAGFIGSHLLQRLLELGQDVHGLDDFSLGSARNLAAVEQSVVPRRWRRFRLLRGDVRDPELLAQACSGRELVLHQAGLGSVPRSLAEPARCVSVNVEGTWRLLAAARSGGAGRLVLASSSSVYGDEDALPQREERIGRPTSPYAASKRAAELVAEGCARGGGPACVALRYFNVFGPRQDPDGPYAAVIPRWIRALLAGRAPRLEGDGSQSRDFTPVRSVVAANLLAACVPLDEAALVLNVGTGRATTLSELLALLRRLCTELGVGDPGVPAQRFPARPGDRRASLADLEAARTRLGFEPTLAIEEELRATVRHLTSLDAASVDPAGG